MDKRLSIKRRQIEALTSMLNLSQAKECSSSIPDWKFIIYDAHGRDIIDSLFLIKDLRKHYVTLRLPINSTRDYIPDPISAIYFLQPSRDNVMAICQDLSKHLYDSYYFNFISTIPDEQLQLIAESALQANATFDVKLVKNQLVDFISIEEDFFILKETDRELVSYFAINRSDTTDEELTQVIERIVNGLYSFLITLQLIPIIRCPKNGPAEVVAEMLNNKLKNVLNQKEQTLFNQKLLVDSTNGRRPLMCLIDRTVDMSTPLHHTWTYQALIHDLFDIKLNMLSINEGCDDDQQETKTQLFDLNQEDKFWQEQKGSPFPEVADAVQREIEEFKKLKDDNNLSVTNIERILKKHTTMATAVLDEIKSRKLDNFFEFEEKLMNKSPIDKVAFDEMLASPKDINGLPNDKYRFFLISYICDNPILSEEEAEKYVDMLVELGCNRAAFEYVKQWKTFSRSSVVNLQTNLMQSGGGVLKTASMFTKLVSQGSQFVMEGVKNLVLREYHLPITKIVDNLMESSSNSNNKWSQEYRYFDPLQQGQEALTSSRKTYFQDAIVFVVGGGNYIEYQNLVDYNKSKNAYDESRSIIYGATDLMNANLFLEQLVRLGEVIQNN